jgi:hypothetical protein
MSEGAPKSALELVMERLRKKDAESGVTHAPLTDAQKQAIADARAAYDARVAEREIMHRDKMYNTFDPAAREQLHDAYLKDIKQYAAERDEKIERIREAAGRA